MSKSTEGGYLLDRTFEWAVNAIILLCSLFLTFVIALLRKKTMTIRFHLFQPITEVIVWRFRRYWSFVRVEVHRQMTSFFDYQVIEDHKRSQSLASKARNRWRRRCLKQDQCKCLIPSWVDRLSLTDRSCSNERVSMLLLSMINWSSPFGLGRNRGASIDRSLGAARLPQLPNIGRWNERLAPIRRLTSVAGMSEMSTEFTEVDGVHSLAVWQEKTGRDDDQDNGVTSSNEMQGRWTHDQNRFDRIASMGNARIYHFQWSAFILSYRLLLTIFNNHVLSLWRLLSLINSLWFNQ